MRVCEQIQRTSGLWYSAEYSTFSISDEVGNYTLTVAGYSGDAGDAMIDAMIPQHASDGQMFSTPERDNDQHALINCAEYHGSGWWFGACSVANVNKDTDSIWTTAFPVWDVQASRVLVKLN